MAMAVQEKIVDASAPYSLRNRVIVADEITFVTEGVGPYATTDGDRVSRFLTYNSTHEPELAGYAQKLQDMGLVLGRPEEFRDGQTVYHVPPSARPLGLEPPSYNDDPAGYTDGQMIYDLGILFGTVSRVCGNRVVIIPAEDTCALVEFVHPGERQLYLLPGTEQLLSDPVDGDALTEQLRHFGPDFSDAYGSLVGEFIQGYTAGREGQ
ncbi:MAG TPA: hypothetical protein VLH84_04120 [Patescibacteria group bacterium]|nr:hypothetical protein [Patescibacteria group bacterium]